MKEQERTPETLRSLKRSSISDVPDNLVNLFKRSLKGSGQRQPLKDLQELQAAFNAVKSADELTKDRLTNLLVTVDKVQLHDN